MFEKNGIKFYDLGDAKYIEEGYYHLYESKQFDNIYTPDSLEYKGIIEYHKYYDDIYEFSIIGWEVPIKWELINISNRGIQKNYLVGPISSPIKKEDLINYV
jgi:hypothetical protein